MPLVGRVQRLVRTDHESSPFTCSELCLSVQPATPARPHRESRTALRNSQPYSPKAQRADDTRPEESSLDKHSNILRLDDIRHIGRR